MTEQEMVEEVTRLLDKIYDVLNSYNGDSVIADSLYNNYIENACVDAQEWLRGKS